MKATCHFDGSYRERACLRDGSEVVLRLMRPADRDELRRGFGRLSPRSRYLRFFSAKNALTEDELDQLVNPDGIDSFALVAVSAGERPEGLGVARFARLSDRPDVAEPAVTVVDHAQGKGLATLLLSRLAAAARERGVRRFACEFLAVNEPVLRLLERYAGDAMLEQRDDILQALVPVPEIPASARPSRRERRAVLFRLLGESARGALELRVRHLLLKDRKEERR